MADYRDVGASPMAYHELLRELWASGMGFTIVEQDIVPWPGALARLEACSQSWCGFAYQLTTGYGSYLGCVRFATDLLQAYPSAIDAIDTLPPDGTPRRYWGRLDTRLKQVLETAGYAMDVHWPAVGHLNPAQQLIAIYTHTCGYVYERAIVESGPPPWFCPVCA